jgi:pyridinium-3,5-bisthiocarboxylic acid mononucleotide nickel chelatase
MTIAYFDCFSGIAGDMVLGALVDAGLPLKYLKDELKKLDLGSYELKRVQGRLPISGTNMQVAVKKDLSIDDYVGLDQLISKSGLKKGVKDMSRAILERLARAEASVHGTSIEKVHFHEVGTTDSMVDIVGAAIAFDRFKFSNIYASPIPITRGRVKCAHGTFPVPAPATMELLKGIPLEPAPIKDEIVTPTGAAIITTVAESFGECPLQKVSKVGYGYGDKVFPGIPNALRVMIGEGFPVVVVQANIDDMNPEIFDHVIDQLFKKGAVDVDLTAIQMKENRPAIKLSAMVPWESKEKIIDVMMTETTTFGVRYYPVERKMLIRDFKKARVKGNEMIFKVGTDADGNVVKIAPEYREVKKLARKLKRPVIDVYRESLIAAAKMMK